MHGSVQRKIYACYSHLKYIIVNKRAWKWFLYMCFKFCLFNSADEHMAGPVTGNAYVGLTFHDFYVWKLLWQYHLRYYFQH